MSINAYQTNQRVGETPRQTEYRLFGQITRDLIAAKEAHDKGELNLAILNALSRNGDLWEALAADLLEPDNMLPDALRGQLLSIALFVDRHTLACRRMKASIQPLIDVNRNIMGGLQP